TRLVSDWSSDVCSSDLAVAEAEAAAVRAEAAHSTARQGLDFARGPFDQAERRLQRLDGEARGLAKLLGADAQKLWPPAIDLLTRSEERRGGQEVWTGG